MTALEVRPMTAADVDDAAAMYAAGGWGERREFLQWVLANPAIRPLVGVADGAIAATGMATIDGPVGWVGSIFVDVAARSRGFGRAMTEAACSIIDEAGCRTQALIASPHGKPLYDSMGFRVDASYQILEAAALPEAPAPPAGRTLRPITASDMPAVCALDSRATGEDRSALLGSLASNGWIVEAEGELRGFLLSILPDCGAVIAPRAEDAACLLDQLRHLAVGRSGAVHAAVPAGHRAGRLELERLGWRPAFRTPRMLRGAPVEWDPRQIWGILGFAFG